MKVVIINGQNHKGSTYHIGRMLADNISNDENITEFFLPRDLNHFCLGCYTCMENLEKCPFYNEKQVIANAMDEADLIILTSPNYCMMPSAPMKSFIDLFYQYWIPHRPNSKMFKKKAVVISTTAGMGASKVCKQLKRTLAYWGVPYIKEYSLAVQASNWEMVSQSKKDKIERDISKLAIKVSNAKEGIPSLYIRFLFTMMKLTKEKDDHPESDYWRENGWFDGVKPWKKD